MTVHNSGSPQMNGENPDLISDMKTCHEPFQPVHRKETKLHYGDLQQAKRHVTLPLDDVQLAVDKQNPLGFCRAFGDCKTVEDLGDDEDSKVGSDSDTGSDIFMPGGITVKASHIRSENESALTAMLDTAEHNVNYGNDENVVNDRNDSDSCNEELSPVYIDNPSTCSIGKKHDQDLICVSDTSADKSLHSEPKVGSVHNSDNLAALSPKQLHLSYLPGEVNRQLSPPLAAQEFSHLANSILVSSGSGETSTLNGLRSEVAKSDRQSSVAINYLKDGLRTAAPSEANDVKISRVVHVNGMSYDDSTLVENLVGHVAKEMQTESQSKVPDLSTIKNGFSLQTDVSEISPSSPRNIFDTDLFDAVDSDGNQEPVGNTAKNLMTGKSFTVVSKSDNKDASTEDDSAAEEEVNDYQLKNATCTPPPIEDAESKPGCYELVTGNVYHPSVDKKKSRANKEVRRMRCECPFEPDDPLFVGCGEDCLNRLLHIECFSRCPCGEFCTNRSFQKGCMYNLEIFKAGLKGWGLKTLDNISKGAFVVEYCGEVVNYTEFHNRTDQYHLEGRRHYYFMTLKTNEIIDATLKGGVSRFINHSCDPNCVTQKWTVNGYLRVGFFALRHIKAGEELSFDYQLQRYGEKPQTCYCGTAKCRGFIGADQSGVLPSYIEKVVAGCSSPTLDVVAAKKKSRKKQMKDFIDSDLARELTDLLGDTWVICDSNQALELTRLMVKSETLYDRQELLKVLQASFDPSAIKAFVRYKGLSLLWSWMVDASEGKLKYRLEILKTLKHVRIPNKTELDDSKLFGVVLKWSKPTSYKPVRLSDDDQGSGSDSELKIDEAGSTSQDESSKEDVTSKKRDRRKSLPGGDSMEEGEIVDTEDEHDKKPRKKDKAQRKLEKELALRDEVALMASSLLDEWKSLKEIFRIPKKSQTPDRRARAEQENSPVDEKKHLKLGTIESPLHTSNLPLTSSSADVLPASGSPPVQRHRKSGDAERQELRRSDDGQELTVESSSKWMGSADSAEMRHGRSGWRKVSDSRNDGRKFRNRNRDHQPSGWSENVPDSFRSCDNSEFYQADSRDTDYSQPELSQNVDSTQVTDMEIDGSADKRDDDPSQKSRKGLDFLLASFGRRLEKDEDKLTSDAEQRRWRRDDSRQDWDSRRDWSSGTQAPSRDEHGQSRGSALSEGEAKDRPLSGRVGSNRRWQRGRGGGNRVRGDRSRRNQPWADDTRNANAGMGGAWRQHAFAHERVSEVPNPLPPPPLPPFLPGPTVILGMDMTAASASPSPGQGFAPCLPNQLIPPHPLMPVTPLMSGLVGPGTALPGMRLHLGSGVSTPVSTLDKTSNCNPTPVGHPHGDPNYSNQTGALRFDAPISSTGNLVNQLKFLVNAERLKEQALHERDRSSALSTPEASRLSTSSSPTREQKTSLLGSPVRSRPAPKLHPDWKSATDPEGRTYYYHAITRQTTWEAPLQSTDDRGDVAEPSSGKKGKRRSSSLDRQTSLSPRLSTADSTHHQGPHTPPEHPQSSSHSSSKKRDLFKSKISAVVVNCLNPYQKVGCKQGRIRSGDDFKYLARKLTHGLMMKEVARIKNEELLECNDSVKVKVKEYIRNYMKKFGALYVRS